MAKQEESRRLEALSDAIFGIALTFLVVRMDVPSNFDEFQSMTGGFAGFFVTFILLFIIWNKQGRFLGSIEYIDNTLKYLTAGFLFLILYFVFPLKYLFTLTIELFVGPELASASVSEGMDSEAIGHLVRLFALGIGAIYLLLALMYAHGLRRCKALRLHISRAEAKMEIFHHLTLVCLAMTSYFLSLYLTDSALYVTGLVYCLIIPAKILYRWKITSTQAI